MHGSIWRVKCLKCGIVRENRDVPIEIPPVCGCRGVLRPAVVWFGEAIPGEVIDSVFNAVDDADFMMIIGTSGIVQPAASLGLKAKGNGAYVVEINPEETPLSGSVDEALRLTACNAAEAIEAAV
jgi:NAD-dependent deacetylase